jgi:hypothetical protein
VQGHQPFPVELGLPDRQHTVAEVDIIAAQADGFTDPHR